MARSRKQRSRSRKQRKQQRGGGWGFTGAAFSPAGGMAPEASRALTDDCAVLDRPAPSVTPTGAWSQSGGGCGSCAVMAPTPQVGGGWLSWLTGGSDVSGEGEQLPSSGQGADPAMEAIPVTSPMSGGRRRRARKQRGGGGGTGGYGFVLNNDLGKVYPSLSVGACPSGQRGGGGASLGDASVVSYPAGYGYAPASAMEVGDGTAHFLAQIPYGKQCMGGGARRATGGKGGRRTRRRGARRATQRRGRKARKSRRHH
jgi:hypothetical protein